jgi:cysteine desulfurase
MNKISGSVEIYLDDHTITRPSAAVVARMNDCFREKWGTVLAPHQKGQELYPVIDEALNRIYALLETPEQIHFALTQGGFDAQLKFFVSFYLDEIRQTGKNHVLSSSIEEAPILLSLNRLEELDCVIKLLPVNEKGQIRLDALEESLKTKTSLLTFSWANRLTGVIQPVEEILQVCHAKGVKVHLNGSYMLSTVPWNEVDYLSFDGDKIGTPQGIGGLFQKKKPRESNQNVAALCGLAVALEETLLHSDLETVRLRDTFEAELKLAIPDCQILFQDAERLPHISAIAFPGVMAESLLYLLNRRGLFASIGGGETQKLSVQLKQCGIPDEICHSAISFALSRDTKEDDLAEALDVIVSSIRQLKTLSQCL